MTPANKAHFERLGRLLLTSAEENPSAQLGLVRVLDIMEQLGRVATDFAIRPEANDQRGNR